jgi:inorganic phosphate transporter, PiT family
MTIEILLGLAAVFMAASNGANDNFKGFATVWGSETLRYQPALALATVATILGSLMSIVLANSLIQQFSGKGLVPPALAGNPAFIANVALAAACTVSIATRLGLPVSTTHALIGGLVGAGLANGRGVVNFAQLTDALCSSPIGESDHCRGPRIYHISLASIAQGPTRLRLYSGSVG